MGKAPVGINTAIKTDAIDPRISIALDIISRVCDNPENLVQDVLREEQGHKVCVKHLHCWQPLLICVQVAIKSHSMQLLHTEIKHYCSTSVPS